MAPAMSPAPLRKASRHDARDGRRLGLHARQQRCRDRAEGNARRGRRRKPRTIRRTAHSGIALTARPGYTAECALTGRRRAEMPTPVEERLQSMGIRLGPQSTRHWAPRCWGSRPRLACRRALTAAASVVVPSDRRVENRRGRESSRLRNRRPLLLERRGYPGLDLGCPFSRLEDR